ncbi:FeoA domain-containing protein [Desulfurococcaceae archaeon MEX13E-LK6-19]|nr:FeoA domain-containing protein [Desulfurococcaceae archaeon MEX13E-LK6-19]
MMPLAYARSGSLVRVVSIRAGVGLARRLRELGIIEGSILRVVRSSGPGPVIVEVIDGVPKERCPWGVGGWCSFCYRRPRLVLGAGMAMKVFVEEVNGSGR